MFVIESSVADIHFALATPQSIVTKAFYTDYVGNVGKVITSEQKDLRERWRRMCFVNIWGVHGSGP